MTKAATADPAASHDPAAALHPLPKASYAVLGVVAFLFMVAGVVQPDSPGKSGPEWAAFRQGQRVKLLYTVRSALERYHALHGAYPGTGGRWQGDCEAFGGFGYGPEGYIPGLVPDFMDSLPRDPDARYPLFNAGVAYRSDGSDYKLILFHTPEAFPEPNPFEDLERPFWAWQVCSPGAADW